MKLPDWLVLVPFATLILGNLFKALVSWERGYLDRMNIGTHLLYEAAAIIMISFATFREQIARSEQLVASLKVARVDLKANPVWNQLLLPSVRPLQPEGLDMFLALFIVLVLATFLLILERIFEERIRAVPGQAPLARKRNATGSYTIWFHVYVSAGLLLGLLSMAYIYILYTGKV